MTGKELIRYYEKGGFVKISGGREKFEGIEKTFDFLPIITNKPMDDKVLATWEKHLCDQGIPYLITEEKGIRKLWKEDIVF